MKTLTRKFGFSISALLPVMLLSVQGQPVQAQDTEPKIYSCKQCVKYAGWRGVVDFGIGSVSDDSPGFGNYRGLDEKGFYAALDGDIHFRNLEGRYFDLYATNLGYDSREIDMRAGNQGAFQIRLGWQEIPRYRDFGAFTPFIGAGSDYLTLPDNWVKANTTSGMSALESSLVPAKIRTQREILDFGATVNFLSNFEVRADYQRQEKKGLRELGAGVFYSNASILPAPVDFTTDLFDAAVSWSGKHAQVELGFVSSQFDNGFSSLSWENPFRSQTELSVLGASLEPSNKYHQFNLSGAVSITPKIRLSGQAATGRIKQNDPFLPYTTNPRYSDLPLPRASLEGQVDTSTYNFAGKLFARVNNKLSFTARGKWDERENKTPVDLYTPVITDLIPLDERYNRPYSYKRQLYSADLRYRAHRMIRLSGGGKLENIDRTLQAVETTEETTWWAEAKVTPTYYSQLRFKLETADRKVDDYLQPVDGGPIENPLMRKYNMADRERDRVVVELDLMPTEAIGVNFSYYRAESDYDESVLGLQESTDQSYTVNFNYAVGEKIDLYAWLTRDDIDASMSNASGSNASPWNAVTDDRITTMGVGASSRLSDSTSIGVDYVSSDSRGRISVETAAEEPPFDILKTDLTNLKAYFNHEINDHWGYKLYAEYEKFSGKDWAIDGFGPDGINSVLSLGQQIPDYSTWYFRIQASYRF